MAFTPIAFSTIRTNIYTLLDAALTENIYYEDPDALSFPRVVIGAVNVASEEQIAIGNVPAVLLSIPLTITTSVAGQTKDGARTQLWTLLGKVQDTIREYPDFNNYAGCKMAVVGDFIINDDGAIIFSVTQNWDIAIILPKS